MKMVIMLMLLLSAVTFTSGAQQRGPRSDYWQYVATASDIHVISSASLKNHLPDMENKINDVYYYQLPVVGTLKGGKTDAIKIRMFLGQAFIDNIKLLPDNTLLIIFILNRYAEFRNSDADEFSNFFIGDETGSIIVYTEKAYREIAGEIESQRVILNERLYAAFPGDEAMDRKIKRLIDELVIEERETAAFEELSSMGLGAVPYIILHMDDFRELPIKYAMVIDESPDGFEEWFHYGPKTVIDMLNIIVNQLTRTSFGYILNGGTNEERQRVLDGWRIYLYYLFHSDLTPKTIEQL
jgi:hypothetical protein